MTWCILMGLVLLWWRSGRVAETIDRGTHALEEGNYSQDVPTRIMVTKHGKAAHCRNDCPFFVCDSVAELVFSLRSKRRFRKTRLEAAHWVVITSFEPQSVLYQFPVSQILVPQLYTWRPCCILLAHDASFQRDTCECFWCKAQTGISASSHFGTKCFRSLCWNFCLRQVILALSRIPRGVTVRNTSLFLHLHTIRL